MGVPNVFTGKTITISGGVTIQDEGTALATTATTLNFVGSGVVASGTGATKTITISGGGGISIGDTVTNATEGSVLFAGAGGVLAQDNANFFWDDTNDRLGIGTNAPEYSIHVDKTVSTVSGGLFSTGSGESGIANDNAGWWLTSQGHNPTNKYCPAIKFGSTDLQFTTDNPKYLAGIVGRATEFYVGDTDGGMALDFLTFPDNGGASGGPTTRMTIDQNGSVGIGTASPDDSSVLEVTSTTKGFLPPRMTTTERDAINLPEEGLMVYDVTVSKVSVFNGSVWKYLSYE